MVVGKLNNQYVIDTYEQATHLSGDWVRASCPDCIDRISKSGGLTLGVIQQDSGALFYHCFRCLTRGVVAYDADLDSAKRPEKAISKPLYLQPPADFLSVSEELGFSSYLAKRYLQARGVSPSIWRHYDLHFATGGYWSGRLIIPHKDSHGNWLGWIARDYTGKKPAKYLYPKGMIRTLWNPKALESSEYLVVVEGAFDAFPLYTHYPTVATLGSPSRTHTEQLASSRARKIVLCFDADAIRKTQALHATLTALYGKDTVIAHLPPGRDPGDLPQHELLSRIRQASQK